MLTVGLTGGPCCGKSTVLKYLKSCGAKVVDSDRIVRDLVKKGRPAYHRIVRRFGKDILNAKGDVDRKKLRQEALSDRKNLVFLEKVLHPAVRRTIRGTRKKLSKKKGILVVEVPLLFESGIHRDMDQTITVSTRASLQKRFAAQRGVSPKDLKQFTKRQWPLSRKIKSADFVIRNNHGLRALRSQVKLMYQKMI